MFFRELLYKAQSQTFAVNSLYAWGLNSSGQLGVYPAGLSLTQISIGTSHNVAITSDSRLITWGQNTAGQLGDNTVVSKSNPIQIGLAGWVDAAAGGSFTVAAVSYTHLTLPTKA